MQGKVPSVSPISRPASSPLRHFERYAKWAEQRLRTSGLGLDRIAVTNAYGSRDHPPAARRAWLFPYRRAERAWDDVPMVSCLMVTQAGRHQLAEQAIECYRRQTWPRRELVIVDEAEDGRLLSCVERLNDPTIRYLRLPVGKLGTLGDLRTFSVRQAAGSYVCQWDDDDLSDPARLEVQMSVLAYTGAAACFLTRVTMWWPDRERLAEKARVWEGSMVCRKEVVGTYQSLSRGEDSHLVDDIMQSSRVAYLDRADLYVYISHGTNTWDEKHFDALWKHSDAQFSDHRVAELLAELGARMPIAAYREALLARRAETTEHGAPVA